MSFTWFTWVLFISLMQSVKCPPFLNTISLILSYHYLAGGSTLALITIIISLLSMYVSLGLH